MKIEIELPNYHYNLLVNVSDYTGMTIEDIIVSTIKVHVEEFDKAMDEYIENEFLWEGL